MFENKKIRSANLMNGGKGFKNSLFAITVLRFVNTFRLRRYLFLSLQRGKENMEPHQPRKSMFTNVLDSCYLAVVDLLT